MIRNGSGIFVQFPIDANKRVLHPATIVDVTDSQYTADLENPDVLVQAGQEFLIYFENAKRFVQQRGRVDAVGNDDPLTFGFALVGDLMSAENRQCFRVSAAMADVNATLAGQECSIQEMSATGFSVITTQQFLVGHIVNAVLKFEDQNYSGRVCVQGTRELTRGRKLYGLHAISDRDSGGTLPKGLQNTSMQLQRQQLRRLRRTG